MRMLLYRLFGINKIEVDLQNLTGYTKMLVKDVGGFQNYLRTLHDELALLQRRVDMLEAEAQAAKKKAAGAG